MNPQFHIQIPRSVGGGGSQSGNQPSGGSGSSKCHVVVSVTQVAFNSISLWLYIGHCFSYKQLCKDSFIFY